MTIDIFNFNSDSYEPPLSCRSPLCSEKVEQQSKSFDNDSCATTKIHSNDSTSSTSIQSGKNDSTTFDFKLSRLPQGTQEEIVALCYAAEILDVIRNLKIYDCQGCVITALSQQDHTCLARGYEETVAAFFRKAIDIVDADKVRRRLRSFHYHPKFVLCPVIPSKNEYEALIINCGTIWSEFVYQILIKKFDFVKILPYCIAREIDDLI